MNSSSPPVKIYTAFAQSATTGYITQVPQTTTTPGAFSWTLGSGPETFLPVSSGGTPPLGNYFNGLMNQVSDNLRWINAGNIFAYDATYAANIGGYAKNAVLLMASGNGFWRSTVENNTVNPETGTPSAPATGWAVITPNTYPWSQITGAPNFTLESEFTGSNQSLVTNGYQKLPGGLILQWCQVPLTSVANQVSAVSFPIAFPNSTFNVQATVFDSTLNSGTSSNQILISTQNITLTGCNVVLGQNGGGPRNITVFIYAVGR